MSSSLEPKGGQTGKHVVIIGAGAGGTCLAARLGKMGHRVTVVEKNTFGGGRCSLLTKDGHRWDQGPSLYLMPEVFEAAFASLGEKIEDHLTFHRCDPTYRIHLADGRSLSLSSNLTEMGAMLEKFERPFGNEDPLGSFLAFLKEAGENYEESVRHVLTKDWSAWWSFFRPELFPMLWRTGALRIYGTLYGRATKYFKSDPIRRAMTFSSMYMGMSPFDAPATYSLLQYAEYGKGVWYPIGGFYKVVEAFESIARQKFGVEFRYGSEVKQITTHGRRTTGVELSSGEKIEADVVISNADLVWTYNNLLPPSSYANTLAKKDQTCSSISFYWGLSEVVPELGGHNIFLADAYQESFDDIFDRGELPKEPSFYVNVPSRLDPTAAPSGKDTIVVLTPCGPLPQKGKAGQENGPTTKAEFQQVTDRARRQVLETLAKRLGRPDFANLIEQEIINDPFDWREKFGLWRGSILGLSHTIPQVLWFRPSPQHAKYENLFFVGASTQPGTGVPVVVAGSGVVADKVDAYLRGQQTGWLSYEALRGSVLLAALVLGLLSVAGIFAVGILIAALLAGLAHYFGLVDVSNLVYSKLKVE
ncbi:unnamed protein product [Parajaminaea phylloscopi]